MFIAITALTTGLRVGQDALLDLAAVPIGQDGGCAPPFYTRLQAGYISTETQQALRIQQADLATAPAFYEIAKEWLAFTNGHILVAEEPRKVYSFVKKAFKELGFGWQAQFVSLEKWIERFAPSQAGKDLQTLCSKFEIPLPHPTHSRGRANALASLLQVLLAGNPTPKQPRKHSLDGLLPNGITQHDIKSLPAEPGVYYFKDKDGRLLYIGKSKNIRARVRTHFQIDLQMPKAVAFKSAIAKIEHKRTGSELMALLTECEEIKQFSPMYNHALRRRHYQCQIVAVADEKGYLHLHIERYTPGQDVGIPVTSRMAAKGLLEHLVEKYELCQKLCGLYKTKTSCFGYSVKKCNGACIGLEPTNVYNVRVEALLHHFKTPITKCLLLGPGRDTSEQSVVIIEDQQLYGYGYMPAKAEPDIDVAKSYIPKKPDNRDIQTILRGFMNNPVGVSVIRL